MTLQLRNCEFAFQCNAEWDKLAETGQDSVRFCNECEKEVHRCETDDELLRAIRSNLCVAIPSPYPTDQTSAAHVGISRVVIANNSHKVDLLCYPRGTFLWHQSRKYWSRIWPSR